MHASAEMPAFLSLIFALFTSSRALEISDLNGAWSWTPDVANSVEVEYLCVNTQTGHVDSMAKEIIAGRGHVNKIGADLMFSLYFIPAGGVAPPGHFMCMVSASNPDQCVGSKWTEGEHVAGSGTTPFTLYRKSSKKPLPDECWETVAELSTGFWGKTEYYLEGIWGSIYRNAYDDACIIGDRLTTSFSFTLDEAKTFIHGFTTGYVRLSGQFYTGPYYNTAGELGIEVMALSSPTTVQISWWVIPKVMPHLYFVFASLPRNHSLYNSII